MAKIALRHLAKGRVFIAIGALHLPGEEGLVMLLSRAGYRATRIDLSGR